jgi:hypothetical protein
VAVKTNKPASNSDLRTTKPIDEDRGAMPELYRRAVRDARRIEPAAGRLAYAAVN